MCAEMSSALAHRQQLMSVEEYLEEEKLSDVRHEYVDGYVYAMAGASDDHNRIAVNILSALHEQLRGKRCEPFMADMKFKIPGSEVVYYPDVLVACEPSDNAKYFRERPTVVFEVTSPDTERTDQHEKRFAYALAPSLKVYVIVSQQRQDITVLRRGRSNSWRADVLDDQKSILKLPEIKADIPLARIYERTTLLRSRG
jgi:Uma2 family endonuclease